MADISKIKLPDGTTHDIHNTKYTFTSGTNSFKVSASDSTGIPQTVIVTPSIANNITGTGTSGYLAKFNGPNTITNGVALGESTTTFLRNDGTWATPPSGTDTKNTAGYTNNTSKLFLIGALEQSANPQTYSNSNCYINGSVFYASGYRVRKDTVNVVEVGNANNAGALLVNDSTGGLSVWMSGSSGMICGKDFAVLENVSGAFKNRVRHIIDTTDHFGKTIWYQGDNVPRVVIQGSNYYEEEYPYPDENKNISLFNKDGEETIYMNSTTGKIHCNQIELEENSGTSRFAKSSGSWTFNNCDWIRYGNVVTVNIKFKGGSSNVSVGSNAIVGTITDIPKPPFTVRLEGYYSGTVLMGELTTSGGFNVRILGQALNLSSSNTATMSGTYVAEYVSEY